MMQRHLLLGLMFLGGSLAFARPAEAQRSGFIIGFGLGPGFSSYTSFPDRESKFGVAFDFHIGGVINSLEIFYVNKVIFTSDDDVDAIVTGVSGVGVAYPLNPDFAVTGAIGIGVLREIDADAGSTASFTGLGLLAGGRYKLNESGRWMLNFDIYYVNPGDENFGALSIWGLQATINVMSH